MVLRDHFMTLFQTQLIKIHRINFGIQRRGKIER